MMTPLQQHEAAAERWEALRAEQAAMEKRVKDSLHKLIADWHTPNIVQFEKAKEILRGKK